MHEFKTALSNDEAMTEALAAATAGKSEREAIESLIDFARLRGFAFTMEDIEAARHTEAGEDHLSEAELEAVAGGSLFGDIFVWTARDIGESAISDAKMAANLGYQATLIPGTLKLFGL
ncbi:nif11-like leader peptide domain-containing protein [Fulvimarina manganoxydans]|uniref:Nif11-like leader peptide domain-containing protein n=2 Tax=Fulvimarina manganoxydans TaxID=937218 RepID=A0A1W2D303_9HYPH|nr:nif11-like leader peptide domain-containing protein [Fulvimarina manganoxydans]